jgi:hypothetical protein
MYSFLETEMAWRAVQMHALRVVIRKRKPISIGRSRTDDGKKVPAVKIAMPQWSIFWSKISLWADHLPTWYIALNP